MLTGFLGWRVELPLVRAKPIAVVSSTKWYDVVTGSATRGFSMCDLSSEDTAVEIVEDTSKLVNRCSA